MAALKRGDYKGLGDAIKREREAIDALPAAKNRKTRK